MTHEKSQQARQCEIPLHRASSQEIVEILKQYHTVAVVGLSANPERDSHTVGQYLKDAGYRIIPVNPRYDEVLGEPCYASLTDVPEPVEVVDIFRRPDAVPPIVEQAIQIAAKVIWMQTGIVNNRAAAHARDAGLRVVMDRCMMAEHRAICRGTPE